VYERERERRVGTEKVRGKVEGNRSERKIYKKKENVYYLQQ